MENAMSLKEQPKKMGRPPTGKAKQSFANPRLPEELRSKIESWMKRRRITNRSEAIRRLIEEGLKK